MVDDISPEDLVPMDVFCGTEPIEIDLVYANAKHPENIFGIAAYRAGAHLILHRDLARVVLTTSRLLQHRYEWILILKDGLRTIEAQQALIETEIARANPHWLNEPRMLSGPGQGAHPRGMAIDVSVKLIDGTPIDMGTKFDDMIPQSSRTYDGFKAHVQDNRAKLEKTFTEAAEMLGLPLLPLPSEWWDFRFPSSYAGRFAPLSDRDLPPPFRMHTEGNGGDIPDFTQLAKDILLSI